MLLVTLAGVATAFNFLIILWKYSNNRILDASLDLLIFIFISIMFVGTITGLEIGMVASMIVSIYLLIYPPKIKLKTDFLKDLF